MGNQKVRFLGIVGLVILLFGIVGGFFIGATHPIMVTHIIVGVILLGVWFALYGSKNMSAAPEVIKGRRSRFGFNAVLYGVVFLGVVGSINYLAAKDRYNVRWDFTEEGVFSLSDQTQKIIKDLKQPLQILLFNTQGAKGNQFDTVKLYSYYSDKVSVEIVDPNAKPHLVDKYGMKPGNVVYIAYGPKDKIEGESRLNEFSEDAITNAVVKLTRGAAKKVYFLIGHGEPDLEAQDAHGMKLFSEAVIDEHMALETLNLAQKGSVPADAAAIVVVSPKAPMFPEEKKAIIDYADKGGKLLLLKDPGYPVVTTDIQDIASHYGIKIGDDLVLDTVMRLFAGPSVAVQFMATSAEVNPITQNISQRDRPIFNLASSVSVTEKKEGATYTNLFKSSDAGWAESDVKTIFTEKEPTVGLDSSDTKGPVTLAVSYEKEIKTPGKENVADADKTLTRVVVFGDSDWMTNALFQQSASHRDLALNSLSWLVGESSNISIRPKKFKSSMVRLPRETFYIVLGSGFFVPELILILGLFVWWRRKIA